MTTAVILPFWAFVVVAVLAAWAANDKLLMLVVIHMTFIVSAIMLAYLDKMAVGKQAKADHQVNKEH